MNMTFGPQTFVVVFANFKCSPISNSNVRAQKQCARLRKM